EDRHAGARVRVEGDIGDGPVTGVLDTLLVGWLGSLVLAGAPTTAPPPRLALVGVIRVEGQGRATDGQHVGRVGGITPGRPRVARAGDEGHPPGASRGDEAAGE